MRPQFWYLLMAGFTLCACAQNDPVLKGPVTRYASVGDFEVSGRKVLLEPGARVFVKGPDGVAITASETTRVYVGEMVSVFGAEQRGARGIRAQRVEIAAAATHAVDGAAIVEAVIAGPANEVRADGYRIRMGQGTQAKFEKPMASFADVKAGVVVRYKGTMQADGVVLAESIGFFRNEIPEGTKKLRAEWEFDPDATPADSHQSGTDRFIRGRDPRYFPRYKDEAVQARVSAIGAKLTPEFQRQ